MSQRLDINDSTNIQNEIHKIVYELGGSESLVQQASQIYELSYEYNLYRGRQKDVLIGASIYIASAILHKPKPSSRISEELNISQDKLFNTYRHFKKNLDIPVPISTPKEYFNEIEKELDISEDAKSRTRHILTICEQTNYSSGKAATGVVAGAIYLAVQDTEDKITQQYLSELIGVSTVTIRTRYKEQKQLLQKADDEFTENTRTEKENQ